MVHTCYNNIFLLELLKLFFEVELLKLTTDKVGTVHVLIHVLFFTFRMQTILFKLGISETTLNI